MDKMLTQLFVNILSDDYTMGRLLMLLKPRHISTHLCVVINICQIYIKKKFSALPPPIIALLPHRRPECTKIKVDGEMSL